jgi:cytosolic carboxypeptidase protein 2/3
LLKAAFEEEINSFYENNADVFKTIDDTHNTVGDGSLFGRRYDHFGLKMRAYISDHFHKKAIIITSRVHPGEPQSSHMLQGMLDFLISDEAADLRRNFVFRIIPMLNIDGVIFGNQRCSLLGVDLNRRWVSPNVFLHPTIFYAKHLVRHMHNERRVLMYCDLHGHSRKQNAFFYACTYKNYEHEGRIKNAQIRMMPLLCCHKAPNHFKFADCRFRIEKCKESTARVVIFREFNIMNAFTLESSFFGKEPE